jgi:starvation-inducible outer membrane lipoprotein
MNLRHLIMLSTMIVCAVLSGCAANRPFPPQVMEKVSPTFHFEAWRDASPSNPSGVSDSGLRVELGGRIVQASKNGKGYVIVAEELPIVEHPVYGPTEDVKRTGDYEFAFLYPGEIEPPDLRNGNRFVIVGTTTSRRPVLVNGISKTEPFLVADCIHVWRTGRTEIAEFKEDVGGGYSPLPEKTYCAKKQ